MLELQVVPTMGSEPTEQGHAEPHVCEPHAQGLRQWHKSAKPPLPWGCRGEAGTEETPRQGANPSWDVDKAAQWLRAHFPPCWERKRKMRLEQKVDDVRRGGCETWLPCTWVACWGRMGILEASL